MVKQGNKIFHMFIGILTQPALSNWKKPNRTTYLAASYVKYIEATGAQVVPIRYKISKEKNLIK